MSPDYRRVATSTSPPRIAALIALTISLGSFYGKVLPFGGEIIAYRSRFSRIIILGYYALLLGYGFATIAAYVRR